MQLCFAEIRQTDRGGEHVIFVDRSVVFVKTSRFLGSEHFFSTQTLVVGDMSTNLELNAAMRGTRPMRDQGVSYVLVFPPRLWLCSSGVMFFVFFFFFFSSAIADAPGETSRRTGTATVEQLFWETSSPRRIPPFSRGRPGE